MFACVCVCVCVCRKTKKRSKTVACNLACLQTCVIYGKTKHWNLSENTFDLYYVKNRDLFIA